MEEEGEKAGEKVGTSQEVGGLCGAWGGQTHGAGKIEKHMNPRWSDKSDRSSVHMPCKRGREGDVTCARSPEAHPQNWSQLQSKGQPS